MYFLPTFREMKKSREKSHYPELRTESPELRKKKKKKGEKKEKRGKEGGKDAKLAMAKPIGLKTPRRAFADRWPKKLI